MARGFATDEFGVPTLDAVAQMPAEERKHSSRLDAIIDRLVSDTEESALGSMDSEHASYASTRKYLSKLVTRGRNHIKSIGDEAAAVVMGDVDGRRIVLAYSSESHNSPSYICAHPGAATGIGGVLRDNAALTLTIPDITLEARRQSHPSWGKHGDPIEQHLHETTKGIGAYSNAMGIPHMWGSMTFDEKYDGNNLVNVMTGTVTHADRLLHNKVPETGDPSDFVAIYVGKASDRTGIGGTKMASEATDIDNVALNLKAVQDPDPHLEYAVLQGLELLRQDAFEHGYHDLLSVKDMGAAGLLCSTLEQLHDDIGVVINGDLVPTNIDDLSAMELLEAETQERMFIYAHEDVADRVLDIFNDQIGLPFVNKGARAQVIGRCNGSGQYTFVRNGEIAVDLPVTDFEEAPAIDREVSEPEPRDERWKEPDLPLDKKIGLVLDSAVFKSDAPIHSHYDSHVRSTNIVRRGEGAAPLRTHALLKGKYAYSASFDSNSLYGQIDPKFQAEDSFIRGAYRMALVGCSPIGVTNNANYGRTDVPEEMWEFVRGQEGVANVCRQWELEQRYLETLFPHETIEGDDRLVTVNSGNVSVNKANKSTGTAIPPTTILGLVGWTDEPDRYATWDIRPESTLYLIGARSPSLDGTAYAREASQHEFIGSELFDVNYDRCQKEVAAIRDAVRSGLIMHGNVIEDGGLVEAVAEMAVHSPPDQEVLIDATAEMGHPNLTIEQKLFSESYGVVVQSSVEEGEFLDFMAQREIPVYKIGETRAALHPGLNIATPSGMVSFEGEHIRKQYHNKIPSMMEAAR